MLYIKFQCTATVMQMWDNEKHQLCAKRIRYSSYGNFWKITLWSSPTIPFKLYDAYGVDAP